MMEKRDNFWSERMVFGALIIGGYLLLLGTVSFFPLPTRAENLVAQGLGALGGALGVIVAAIWKTDKTDRAQTEALTTLAAQGASSATVNVIPPGPGAPMADATISGGATVDPVGRE